MEKNYYLRKLSSAVMDMNKKPVNIKSSVSEIGIFIAMNRKNYFVLYSKTSSTHKVSTLRQKYLM